MGIKDYDIGDELFRYVDGGGVFRYLVIGKRQYDNEVQLEVESQTCTHGWKCKLLIAENDYGHIEHVHMLNDDDESSQRRWHSNDGHYFVKTADEAKQGKIKKMIISAKDQVSRAKDALSLAEKRLKDIQGLDEGVQP